MSLLVDTVLLTAQAPDPGSPAIIPLGVTLGLIGDGLSAWVRCLPDERVSRQSMYGSLLGGACGAIVYCAMYLL
jgi:hypothetical protein